MAVANKIHPSLGSVLGIVPIALAMSIVMVSFSYAIRYAKDVDFSTLVSLATGIGIVMLAFGAATRLASKMSLTAGLGALVSSISAVLVIAALAVALNYVKDIDADKIVAFSAGVTAILIGFAATCAVAGTLGTGLLLKGAVAISAALAVIAVTIRLIAPVIKSILVSIGDGLAAIRNGVTGMSDNKNLAKDLEASFNAINAIAQFLGELSVSAVAMRWNPETYKKLMQILDNIRQFGDAIGAVSAGINGLSKTKYEADTNAAIQVMNSVAEALIGLQEFGNKSAWEKKVTGGISSWWKTTDTMIGQVLSDIDKFGSVVGTVREAVSGLSKDKSRDADGNKTATVLQDTNVAAEMMKQVADVLSELNDLASTKTWAKPKLMLFGIRIGTKLQLQDLLENVKLFGDVVGTVREGVAGLASEKDKDGNSKVLADVDVASQMVTKVTEALGSLSELTKDDTWATPISLVNQIFTGYSTAISPILDTLDQFGVVMKSIYDAVSGVSLEKKNGEYVAETQTTVATTVVDKVVKYLQSLNSSESIKSFNGEATELDDWIFDNQVLVNQLVEDLEQFTPQMSAILTAVKDLADDSTEADAQTAIDAVKIVADFLAGVSDLNIERSRNFFSSLFNGDTKTKSLMDYMGEFGTQIQKMFTNFSGMSESSIEADAATAFSILREFTNLVTWLGSTERPGNIGSNIGIITQVTGVLTGLGAAITEMSTDLEGSNLDTIRQISEFLSSLNDMLSGIKGVEDVAKLFNDLKSLFTDGEGNENRGIPTWLQSIDSDKATTKLTTFVHNFMTNAKPDFESLKNEFHEVGYNLAVGMGNGLFSGTEVAKAQAAAFANAVLSKIKTVLGINSPSKKTFEFGRYTVLGFAKGINDHSRIAEKSMQGMSNGILAQLSSELSQDMDFDPVVRPIVDLSDVVSSSRKMDGLLTTNRSVALAGVATGAVNRYKAEKNGRSANTTSVNGAANVNDSTSVNVNGNFYIRNDQDVKSLASEIATLTKQQQRSLGATY